MSNVPKPYLANFCKTSAEHFGQASNVGFSSAMRLLAVKLEFVEVDSCRGLEAMDLDKDSLVFVSWFYKNKIYYSSVAISMPA